jgi:hypothetical protein
MSSTSLPEPGAPALTAALPAGADGGAALVREELVREELALSEFRCASCGYGAMHALPVFPLCPMCRSNAWVPSRRAASGFRPF